MMSDLEQVSVRSGQFVVMLSGRVRRSVRSAGMDQTVAQYLHVPESRSWLSNVGKQR